MVPSTVLNVPAPAVMRKRRSAPTFWSLTG